MSSQTPDLISREMSGNEVAFGHVPRRRTRLRTRSMIFPFCVLRPQLRSIDVRGLSEIPCLSTRWVRSLKTVHKQSNIGKINFARSQDLNWGLPGEKPKLYLCDMPPPPPSLKAVKFSNHEELPQTGWCP